MHINLALYEDGLSASLTSLNGLRAVRWISRSRYQPSHNIVYEKSVPVAFVHRHPRTGDDCLVLYPMKWVIRLKDFNGGPEDSIPFVTAKADTIAKLTSAWRERHIGRCVIACNGYVAVAREFNIRANLNSTPQVLCDTDGEIATASLCQSARWQSSPSRWPVPQAHGEPYVKRHRNLPNL
jgi:hypothetical protein